MATRHRIDEALSSTSKGDVEAYFHDLVTMIEKNSGVHDFKLITHECYNVNAPFKADQFATFALTDPGVDVVDLSKGFINLELDITYKFDFKNFTLDNEIERNGYEEYKSSNVFFLGFKSGAQIINNYNVISNGRLTACKNTKAKQEQAIVYNSKSKAERKARPGMYSAHENVLKMSKCVCGAYIELPSFDTLSNEHVITLDLLIQVDDLLPFSAMSYYPRFMFGDLTLELSAN